MLRKKIVIKTKLNIESEKNKMLITQSQSFSLAALHITADTMNNCCDVKAGLLTFILNRCDDFYTTEIHRFVTLRCLLVQLTIHYPYCQDYILTTSFDDPFMFCCPNQIPNVYTWHERLLFYL